ncbi:MAG: hypothetical protein ACE37G_17670, partial [Marivita cryptomonadis]
EQVFKCSWNECSSRVEYTMAWQSATGYNRRALVEAQIGRRKLVIGPRLNAREMNRQLTENQIATKSLNRMTRLGRAVFKRAA